jgi:hypothetical protein
MLERSEYEKAIKERLKQIGMVSAKPGADYKPDNPALLKLHSITAMLLLDIRDQNKRIIELLDSLDDNTIQIEGNTRP